MYRNMQIALIISVMLFSISCAGKNMFTEGQWIDLTHEFSEQTIYWPTSSTFKKETVYEGHTEKGFYYSAYKFSTAEHGGTHIDSPIHFYEDRYTVDQIPIEQLIGPGVVVDVSKYALTNPDYQVMVTDILKWESANGQIPDGAILLLNTGYGKFWPDRVKYMGTDQLGQDAVKDLHFPGLHPDTAKWLVKNRKINAVGLDTPSIDYGQSTHYGSHVILFEANIPAFENVANLDKLPATGATVFALPMKIKGGSGSPLRIIANF